MNHIEWRAIAISELIDLLYLLNSDIDFSIKDFQQRVLLLSEADDKARQPVDEFNQYPLINE